LFRGYEGKSVPSEYGLKGEGAQGRSEQFEGFLQRKTPGKFLKKLMNLLKKLPMRANQRLKRTVAAIGGVKNGGVFKKGGISISESEKTHA